MPKSRESAPGPPPLIGALLRIPSEAIHRRLIRDLNAAGFEALSLPHMAVLQFPGPDGVRPGALAERAGISKQAMNQLLGTLEGLGYVARSALPQEGGARVVRLTKRTQHAIRNGAEASAVLLKLFSQPILFLHGSTPHRGRNHRSYPS